VKRFFRRQLNSIKKRRENIVKAAIALPTAGVGTALTMVLGSEEKELEPSGLFEALLQADLTLAHVVVFLVIFGLTMQFEHGCTDEEDT
jgi:hypothetical protein